MRNILALIKTLKEQASQFIAFLTDHLTKLKYDNSSFVSEQKAIKYTTKHETQKYDIKLNSPYVEETTFRTPSNSFNKS